MKTEFITAMAEFDACQAEFDTACSELETVRAIADPVRLARIDARVATCRGAITFAQSGISKIGQIAAALKAGQNISVPVNVQHFALKAARGASIALSGVAYEVRQFVFATRNPGAPGSTPAFIAAGMLAALGELETLF